MELVSKFLTSPWGSLFFVIFGALLDHWLSARSAKSKEKTQSIKTLKAEIAELKEKISYYEDVEQSSDGDYYVLKSIKQPICPVCWGNDHKAIPVYGNDTGFFKCGSCGNSGVFDRKTVERLVLEQKQENDTLQGFVGVTDLTDYF